ncbi:MAG: hypothetical protein WC511_01485 [Candidatus Pacearchaeota archaeon]
MGDIILKSYYKDIFFESLTYDEPRDTILILEGFPSNGTDKKTIELLHSLGYNVFWPHYSGTYQSDGIFLSHNPVIELSGFIENMLSGEFVNLWDMSVKKFGIKKLFLFGGSFSGAICMGLATLQKFDQVLLFSPVLDYSSHNQNGDEQNIDDLLPFVKRAYKHIFRIRFDSLTEKMKSFKECSKDYYLDRIDFPITIFQDPDDKVVSIKHSKDIKRKNIRIIEHSFGHGMNGVIRNEYETIHNVLKNEI